MTNAICAERVAETANNLGLEFVRVRWGWAALPAAAVSLTIVFWIWAASDDQTDVWKNSLLALLFYGLTDKDCLDILSFGGVRRGTLYSHEYV